MNLGLGETDAFPNKIWFKELLCSVKSCFGFRLSISVMLSPKVLHFILDVKIRLYTFYLLCTFYLFILIFLWHLLSLYLPNFLRNTIYGKIEGVECLFPKRFVLSWFMKLGKFLGSNFGKN